MLGGTGLVIPPNVNYLYVRHRHNLGPGIHHYFIRYFGACRSSACVSTCASSSTLALNADPDPVRAGGRP
jgi:hypothetical protein